MSGDSDPLREFQRRLGTVSEVTAGASAELLLDVIDTEVAKLFRLCAIPHHFDADIAHVLEPGLERSEIQKHCEEFSRLSFVCADENGWALNNAVRQHFFSQWLKPQFADEFTDASGRLAAFFKERAGRSQGEIGEIARRRSMFHMLGVDPEVGFREFELLLRRARHNRLYSECNQLIRLVHEYDGFLPARYGLCLAYHEAKLSADLRHLEEAEEGYHRILDDPDLTPELRSATYVRLGYVHNERRNWDEAIRYYERGLALAEKIDGVRHTLPRILHDLGSAFRDRGDLDRAEALLNRSIELAEDQHNLSSLALAYNSLGNLALKRRDVSAAIYAFEKSLDALRNESLFRAAQVYYNLARAYADLPDWTRSEEYYRKSLAIRLNAGDSLGQAMVLNGLARVQASQGELTTAIENTTRAIALFTEMRDHYDAALAKHNRGKLLRRMNERERARKDFTQAMETFRRLGNATEADAAAQDLQASEQGEAFPWRAWSVIVLVVLGVVVLIIVAIES